MQQSRSYTLVFATGTTSSYTVTGLRDPDRAVGTDYQVTLSREPYLAILGPITIGAGPVVSVGGSASISFDGFGVPNASGSIVVGVGSLTRIVSIDAATGDVQVSSP